MSRKRLDKQGYGELKAMSYRAWLSTANVKDDNEIKQFWKDSYCRAASQLNTQRKIINVMWSLWKNGRIYDPDKF